MNRWELQAIQEHTEAMNRLTQALNDHTMAMERFVRECPKTIWLDHV